MSSHLVSSVAFGVILVVLIAVLGAVERREKFAFVAGVGLIIAGPGLVVTVGIPAALGGWLAVLGVLAVLASTVPMLREPPAST